MGSYIVSVSQRPGIYAHIRISDEATLMDLHEAIVEFYEIPSPRRPVFEPLKVKADAPKVRFGTKNSKTMVAMREVSLKNSGLEKKSHGLSYTLTSPATALTCRMFARLDEPTDKPLMVKSSGLSILALHRALSGVFPMFQAGWMPGEHADRIENIPKRPDDEVGMMIDYLLSASNFYGLVPADMVHSMYCRNNPAVTPDSFFRVGIYMSEAENARVFMLDKRGERVTDDQRTGDVRYLAEYTVDDQDTFRYILEEQRGKPWYIPPQEELLRYRDEYYVEQTAEYHRLKEYIMAQGLSVEQAEDRMRDLYFHAKYNGGLTDDLIELMEKHQLMPESSEKMNRLLALYSSFYNNTRLSLNCGHRPAEMFNDAGKKIETLSGRGGPAAFGAGGKDRQPAKKIGRNDPCPCGSGKKYKHCCGKRK